MYSVETYDLGRDRSLSPLDRLRPGAVGGGGGPAHPSCCRVELVGWRRAQPKYTESPFCSVLGLDVFYGRFPSAVVLLESRLDSMLFTP